MARSPERAFIGNAKLSLLPETDGLLVAGAWKSLRLKSILGCIDSDVFRYIVQSTKSRVHFIGCYISLLAKSQHVFEVGKGIVFFDLIVKSFLIQH